ncbi:glycerol-3-phosphate 1-O-acyltransferase PlsY [Dyella lutea]|uniref:Glycerol-3-phosphate acyltransferase n=1 Tax=Dyella lutea TaxID=2950441 RepID=A0ABT1FEX9_9GAMM|nr:glycerol-3-phosphate 1-O-acyltransferase PlsY [Dyella lutea]MCP1374762.1 glycerol-3-phosphate 1-O-acyltransferase PlsY [Dyella lutea]
MTAIVQPVSWALTLALIMLAYLLGSLSGSLLLGRLRGVDIRTLGSGNAGGTNALRTQGWRFALGTVLIDIGKGALAAWLAVHWMPDSTRAWAVYVAVLATVAGHVWPLFHGFRGGKGAATLVGALAVAWPGALPVLLAVWLLCLLSTGYVGLSTMLAAISLPLFALAASAGAIRLGFAIAVAALVIYTHRGNLARLRAGTESRFERVRVFRRRPEKP